MKSALQVGKTRKPPKRNTLSFEPCGPLRSMVANELKHHTKPGQKASRGALKQVLESCIVVALAPKYPKLHERYQVLKEEGAL